MGKKAIAEKLQKIENILQSATAFVNGIRLMLGHPDTLHFLSKDMDSIKERLGCAGNHATEI